MQTYSGTYNQNAATIGGQLRRGQAVSLVALGVALWLLFALLIRYVMPTGWFASPTISVLLFMACIPSAWLLVRLCQRTAALTPEQLVPGVAIASAAALPCDGVALTWAPQLYGADAASILPAAAWLFWGAGVCLALAFVMAGRKTI